MTDLEITRLCAEAMGINIDEGMFSDGVIGYWDSEGSGRSYSPLHDDAQAMVLVKRLGLSVSKDGPNGEWMVDDGEVAGTWASDPDLNRAICECVSSIRSTAALPASGRAGDRSND